MYTHDLSSSMSQISSENTIPKVARNEPQRIFVNPTKIQNQPSHLCRLIRIATGCIYWIISKDAKYLNADNEDSDLSVRCAHMSDGT